MNARNRRIYNMWTLIVIGLAFLGWYIIKPQEAE